MVTQPLDRQGAIAARGGASPSAGGNATATILLARAANFVRLRRDLGRGRADRLAERMAERLSALLAPDDIRVVAQDTVEVSLSAVGSVDLATAITAIVHAFSQPFVLDDVEFAIDLVLGGALADGIAGCELRLIEEAEAALADAVRAGAPAIRSLREPPGGFDRAELSRDLLTAVRDDELLLHYQPKIHLRRRHVASVEALLRWQHPVRGLVAPGDFIPLAEETGDIAALTLWTLRRVIADQRAMVEQGHDLTVFVNIAGVLLGDESFVARACDLVGGAGASIGFEITETSVIRDPDSAIANLNRFAAIGIPIAIDDYGAGLSSLAYLKRLPARELKIDKLFVTQLTSSHRDPLIVRSTIDLAHALEMEVVAEGVETQTAMALLTVMGCDMVQGFFVSRPIGLDALLLFLAEHRDGWNGEPVTSPFPALLKRA